MCAGAGRLWWVSAQGVLSVGRAGRLAHTVCCAPPKHVLRSLPASFGAPGALDGRLTSSVCLFVHLSVCLLACLPVCLSVRLSACLCCSQRLGNDSRLQSAEFDWIREEWTHEQIMDMIVGGGKFVHPDQVKVRSRHAHTYCGAVDVHTEQGFGAMGACPQERGRCVSVSCAHGTAQQRSQLLRHVGDGCCGCCWLLLTAACHCGACSACRRVCSTRCCRWTSTTTCAPTSSPRLRSSSPRSATWRARRTSCTCRWGGGAACVVRPCTL